MSYDLARKAFTDRAVKTSMPPSQLVDKIGPKNERIGRERAIMATLMSTVPSLSDGYLVVTAVAYDGNAVDVARPVRLVLEADQAKLLAEQLTSWASFMDATPPPVPAPAAE